MLIEYKDILNLSLLVQKISLVIIIHVSNLSLSDLPLWLASLNGDELSYSEDLKRASQGGVSSVSFMRGVWPLGRTTRSKRATLFQAQCGYWQLAHWLAERALS